MDLDKLEFSLRRRNHWEAVDLGFSLARRWFYPLWLLWLVTALPLGMVFFFLFSDQVWLLALLVWWFKPLYEPPLLFWMSRAVFGETLSVGSVIRQWWRIVRPQIFANLTWRRLSPNRSFNMPVALLEQLKGKERKTRIQLLGKGQHAPTWLTFAGIHFETVLEVSLLILIFVLIPEDLRWVNLEDLLFAEGSLGEWLQLFGSLLCMSIIAPFYVAAGFVLYLHRRSELEAWDIEIGFRRIDQRLKKTKQSPSISVSLVLVVLLSIVGSVLPEQSVAAINGSSPEEVKPIIEEIVAHRDFGELDERGYWKYIGPEKTNDNDWENSWLGKFAKWLVEVIAGFFEGYASFGELLMWIAGICVVGYLLFKIAVSQGLLRLGRSARLSKKKEAPVELFGLDLRPDQFPSDPVGEAKRLIEVEDLRGALSLLYRGALMHLVTQDHVEVPSSATEGECVRLVEQYQSTEEAGFFRNLTNDWLLLAYAHVPPKPAYLVDLCDQWQGVYGNVEG